MKNKLRISDDLALPLEAVTSTFVVYGAKGMGKTNWLAVFAEELAKVGQRFSVLDPVGGSWGLQHAKSGDRGGLEVLILGGRHGDLPIEPTAGAVVADLVADESVSTVVDISRRADGKMWSNGEKIRFAADYMTRLYERQGESCVPLMQIIDEAGRMCPQTIPHGAVDIARCVGAIEQLVELGRNVGVGVTLVTQRSARMAKSVSELADCMIAFRTVGPNSVGAILDWFGEHVVKSRHKELVGHLRTLDVGSALVVSPGWLRFEGVAKMRPRETFDSSKTPAPGQRSAKPGRAHKPDLKKYSERMAATIERAKADDPKALRARIAELEKQAKAPKPAAPAAPPPKRVEVPVLGAKHEKAIHALLKGVEALGVRQAALQASADALTRELQTALKPLVVTIPARAFSQPVASPVPPRTSTRPLATTPMTKAAARPTPAKPPDDSDTTMSRGLRRVLTVLAQNQKPMTNRRIGIAAGVSPSLSTFRGIMAKARANGWVLDEGERRTITDAGLAALGPFEALPTGYGLLQYWLNTLSKGQAAVLQRAAAEYPRTISREEAAYAAGCDAASSTLRGYLAKLRGLDLIEGRGEIRASQELFE
jgi:hypothetical protein